MDIIYSTLVPRAGNPSDGCTMETCSIDRSIYGYKPSFGANVLFAAIFATAAVLQLGLGIWRKSLPFAVVLVVGCVMETGGYVGRILLSKDPFSQVGFQIQIVTLTVAPAFVSAGIYLTLKHGVIVFDSRLSRINPKLYTWTFVLCDVISIMLQAAGGSMAAQGTNLSLGQTLLILGLSFQVLTLLIFGGLALDYGHRLHKANSDPNYITHELYSNARFRLFFWALSLSFCVILIRCIYRVIEMAGGFDNAIMKNEVAFMILDSTMCAIAVALLTVFHPGFLFQESKKARIALGDNAESKMP